VGLEGDEFSWKGLGSKLSYQSRLVEIETWTGRGDAYRVAVNEPWKTIQDGKKPRPRISTWPPGADFAAGTTIRVYGHPPHREERPFEFDEIRDYVLHRTFVGYTRQREDAPRITLTVQGHSEELELGFPELRRLPDPPPEGTVVVSPSVVVSRNLPGTNQGMTVRLHGFYTWDEQEYELAPVHHNTGLLLSVKGIPYLRLPMRELGSGQLAVANPGTNKCCLIAECDEIQPYMNIARSDLVDSAETDHFRSLVRQAIAVVETRKEHLAFRQVSEKRKQRQSAEGLSERKRALASPSQMWVYWNPSGSEEYVRLSREPENETDALTVLWKMEALRALPFRTFETLGYFGAGADLVVNFQEDLDTDAEQFATVEVENRFFNYKLHRHLPAQYPTIVCWDINPKPKLRPEKTNKPYKFVVHLDELVLRIYALRHMPGIEVMTEEKLSRKKVTESW